MLKIAYLLQYEQFLPPGHRFPMAKYSLLAQQLLHEGICDESNFFEPIPPDDKHILAVHDPEYYYDLLNLTISHSEALAIGFPMSRTLKIGRASCRESVEDSVCSGTIKE